jgi:hypothetical protein
MGRLGKTDAMERRGIIVKLKRIRKQMAATMTVEDGKSENQSISVKSNVRYVLEGTGTLKINDNSSDSNNIDKIIIKPGTLVEIGGNNVDSRGWQK